MVMMLFQCYNVFRPIIILYLYHLLNQTLVTSDDPIPFGDYQLVQNYVSRGGPVHQYYKRQIDFFDYGITFFTFLETTFCSLDKAINENFYATHKHAIKMSLPAPINVPQVYYPVQSIVEELHDIFQPERSFPGKAPLFYLLNLIPELIIDEIKGLLKIEFTHIDAYRLFIQHDKKQKLQTISRLFEHIHFMQSFCPHISLVSLQGFSETVQNFSLRYTQLDQVLTTKKKKVLHSRHTIQRIQPYPPRIFTQAEKNKAILYWKSLSKKFKHHSQEFRIDRFSSVEEFIYPISVDIQIYLQMDHQLNVIRLIKTTFSDAKITDTFLKQRIEKKDALIIITQFLKNQFNYLLPLLPLSVLIESISHPIVINGEIRIGLLCIGGKLSQHFLNLLRYEFLHLSIPNILPNSIIIGLLSDLQQSESLLNQFQMINTYSQVLNIDPTHYGSIAHLLTLPTLKDTNGLCHSDYIYQMLSVSSYDHTCIQFPNYFELHNPGHTIWPICMGYYPTGTRIITQMSQDSIVLNKLHNELSEVSRLLHTIPKKQSISSSQNNHYLKQSIPNTQYIVQKEKKSVHFIPPSVTSPWNYQHSNIHQNDLLKKRTKGGHLLEQFAPLMKEATFIQVKDHLSFNNDLSYKKTVKSNSLSSLQNEQTQPLDSFSKLSSMSPNEPVSSNVKSDSQHDTDFLNNFLNKQSTLPKSQASDDSVKTLFNRKNRLLSDVKRTEQASLQWGHFVCHHHQYYRQHFEFLPFVIVSDHDFNQCLYDRTGAPYPVPQSLPMRQQHHIPNIISKQYPNPLSLTQSEFSKPLRSSSKSFKSSNTHSI